MQLVELETQGGGTIWVNPAYIVGVNVPPEAGALAEIYLVGADAKAPIVVTGEPAEVLRKINEAMKT